MERNVKPPYNALAAFREAAKHGSFTKAADHIGVTQGAVSRHIRGLEERYQRALFLRSANKLVLTEAGRALYHATDAPMSELEQACRNLDETDAELRLRVPTTFGLYWLFPRIAQFQKQNPNITLLLTCSFSPIDSGNQEFDAGIDFVRTDIEKPFNRSQLELQTIVPDFSVPVLSPALLNDQTQKLPPESLKKFTLLLDTEDGWDWNRLADQIGADGLIDQSSVAFESDDAAIAAACAGYGVALANLLFVEGYLESGKLVAPFDIPPIELGWYVLLYQRHLAGTRKIGALCRWLQNQVDQIDIPGFERKESVCAHGSHIG